VLVCRGPDCASRGADEVYTAVADAVAAVGLDEEVVQTQCGCVGPLCGRGPVVLSYPSGCWYAGVAPADAAQIVGEDVAAGRPVERLVAVRLVASSA
jgi:(2Fe-2S) ferredoxin